MSILSIIIFVYLESTKKQIGNRTTANNQRKPYREDAERGGGGVPITQSI